MAKAVMQIRIGMLKGDGGAVLLYRISIIPFCCLEVAHQVMQAIGVWVCLVESKISCGCQFFVATCAPVGHLSRIPIRCWQSLQSLESSFILSRFQQCARHSNAKFSGGPRSEGQLHTGCDLRKLPVLDRQSHFSFVPGPGATLLPRDAPGIAGCQDRAATPHQIPESPGSLFPRVEELHRARHAIRHGSAKQPGPFENESPPKATRCSSHNSPLVAVRCGKSPEQLSPGERPLVSPTARKRAPEGREDQRP